MDLEEEFRLESAGRFPTDIGNQRQSEIAADYFLAREGVVV